MEVSGFLVVPAVFKTDVADYVGQAGSIPVRLRHRWQSGPTAGVRVVSRYMRPPSGTGRLPWI